LSSVRFSIYLQRTVASLVRSGAPLTNELMSDRRARHEILLILRELSRSFEFNMIGVVEGLSLAFASQLSDITRKPFVVVRKRERSEPFASSTALNSSRKVLLLDDRIVTGESIIYAASRVEEEGHANVVGGLVIEDHNITKKKRMKAHFPIKALFQDSDYLFGDTVSTSSEARIFTTLDEWIPEPNSPT
jgi:orotate phosphoribosyltransferase